MHFLKVFVLLLYFLLNFSRVASKPLADVLPEGTRTYTGDLDGHVVDDVSKRIRTVIVKIKKPSGAADESPPEIDQSYLDVDSYLEKYGYLPKLGSKDVSHSEDTRKYAIQTFQKFAHLPETGEMDEATSEMMRQPRCGFKDILDSSYDPSKPLQFNAVGKWIKNDVTWSVDSFTGGIPTEQQRTAFENSFRRWNGTSALRLKTVSEDGNIRLSFATGDHGDGDPFDGTGGVLAHAFGPRDGRVHFDNDETWVYHDNQGAELEVVATHEVGHALGLAHSPVRGSVMAPFYMEYTENFRLHIDDIAGMQYLYGRPKEEAPTATPHIDPSVEPEVVIDEKLCKSRIQAATTDRDRNVLLFIGSKIYKLYGDCDGGIASCLIPGYPKGIRQVFKRAPKKVSAAVYIPDHRKLTYLFKGRKVWRYTGSKLDKGFPKQMEKKDLPYKPTAAYIQKNQYSDYQWYLFAGKYFWELTLYSEMISNGVMKTRTFWDHMPPKPDAILQKQDGSIYVFKGKYYNKFDHYRVLLEKKRSIAEDFIGKECKKYV